MNDINEMPPKCQYCPYWEVCEYPWVCQDREQLATNLQQTCNQLATDTISRQMTIDAVSDCGICIQRIVDLPSAQSSSSCSHENDTISRQAAIEAFRKSLCASETENGREYGISFSGVERILKSLPSAQSGIIRCKDCLMHGVCRFEQGLGLNGYCSQAKRRTDE